MHTARHASANARLTRKLRRDHEEVFLSLMDSAQHCEYSLKTPLEILALTESPFQYQ